MGKFEKDAKTLLDAIGGKANVSAVSHCATRMRFVLADEKKANVKAIEAIPAVKGTFTNAFFTMTSQLYQGLKVFQKKQQKRLQRAIKIQCSVLCQCWQKFSHQSFQPLSLGD